MSKKQNIEYSEVKEQLDLFYTTSALAVDERDQYSSTIELYDSIPKFYFGKLPAIQGARTLDTITRNFKHRNKMYEIKLIPGFLSCGGGKRKEFYLTKREEIIENMLIKLAVDGCASLVDDELIIFFTLYQLEKELEKKGHGYNRREIKEAIEILGTAQFVLSTLDDSESYKGNFITDIGTSTRNIEGKGNKKMYVKFNSLVSRAIKRKTTRIINFDLLMKHKSSLARILLKRISHLFTQADISNPYRIKASTIIRDTGLIEYKRFRDTLRKIQEAWDELEKNGMISKYEQKKIYHEKDSRKVIDVVYKVFLSQSFVNDIIVANKVAGENKVQSLPKKPFSEAVEKLQSEFNLTTAEARNMVEKYQLQRITENMSYVGSYTKEIGNKKAFLKSAVAENYAGSSDNEDVVPTNHKKVVEVIHENECFNVQEEVKFQEFLLQIKENLSTSEYNNWFPNISLISHSKSEYVLGVNGRFLQHWIENAYKAVIQTAYKKVYKKQKEIIIENIKVD